MSPKLSVLIPTFNRAHWLGGAIDTVLTPGLDCELVVVDNGSTDGTWDLLQARARLDSRLRPVHWDQNRPAEAYPALLEMARGEYVNFFADDDEMLPGGLERKLAVLEANPETGLVFSSVRCMDVEGRDVGEGAWTVISSEDFTGRRDLFHSLILGNFVPMPAAMFRRSLAAGGGIFRDPAFIPSQDWQFWLDLSRRTSAGYLREPTVRLRQHANQVTLISGVGDGLFIRVNLRVWRHWMLEVDPPYIPSPRDWGSMVRTLAAALAATHGQDREKILEGIGQLQALRDEQNVRLEAMADSGDSGTPEAFLLDADWAGEEWKAVLLGYLTAFAPGEPVALIVLIDPSRPGSPSCAQAQGEILEFVRSTDRERFPDVILAEPCDLLGTLRGYGHFQWVGGNQGSTARLEGSPGRRFSEAMRRARGTECS